MLEKLTLGTRGSALALAQATMTEAALAQAWPGLALEREIIHSTGDLRPDLKLAEFNRGPNPVDKGIFTKELEMALEAGKIDVAVHSLKDVPTELRPGFKIVATLPRANTADVLVSKFPGGLAGLPAGAMVATSSVRRARQLQWLRPDLAVEEIRGNVPTRIDKLATTDRWSALLLARAGLDRLGLSMITTDVSGVRLYQEDVVEEFLPAASQGAVALEIYGENESLAECLQPLNHLPTFTCITAERHFLHLLKAGCQTPVGLRSWFAGDELHMKALIFSERDISAPPQRSHAVGAGTDPRQVAQLLFDNIY